MSSKWQCIVLILIRKWSASDVIIRHLATPRQRRNEQPVAQTQVAADPRRFGRRRFSNYRRPTTFWPSSVRPVFVGAVEADCRPPHADPRTYEFRQREATLMHLVGSSTRTLEHAWSEESSDSAVLTRPSSNTMFDTVRLRCFPHGKTKH